MHNVPGHDPEVITERMLRDWLLSQLPTIKERYAEEVAQHYEPEERQDDVCPYFMLSFVVRRHLVVLLDMGHDEEVQRIFNVLEHLAHVGSVLVQECLWVTMEEMDVWRVWKFLGATMRHQMFAQITWFPDVSNRGAPPNPHVDKLRYQQRWREEIAQIGGFDNLTIANELYIRYKLVQEFGIEGLRAPQPGGEEWLAMELPWPWPPAQVIV